MARQYPDDPQQAAEFVRLALPFMARHGIPTTPPHYRVWYDYVSGRNSKLKETIDRALHVRDAVNEEFSEQLYDQFVELANDRLAEQMRQEIHSLVAGTLESISASSERSNHYQEMLREYANRLSVNPGRDHVRRTVNDLLAETRSMQEANQRLEQRLKRTTAELVSVRETLDQQRAGDGIDGLTGITSRSAFNRRLAEAIDDAQASGRELSVIIADVDNFHALNQEHGRILGDKILRFVAAHILGTIKGSDCAARFGGEEFAVLLPCTPLSGGMALAEQLRSGLESQRLRRTDTDATVGKITLSLGVAGFRNGDNSETFLQRAAEAMQRAKREGRNRSCCETHRA